jgi:uncharacterized repeat protein (TIGR02543 family)
MIRTPSLLLSLALVALTLFGCAETFGPLNSPYDGKNPARPSVRVVYLTNTATAGQAPVDAATYAPGDHATVLAPSADLVKTSFTFQGWNTLADGKGPTYAAGTQAVLGTSDLVLYALWTQSPTFTVTYDGNGATSGSVPVDPNHYLTGALVTVASNSGTLTRDGYSFLGWNTVSTETSATHKPGDTLAMAASNLKFFAVWTQQTTYRVTYFANGAATGSVPVDTVSYLAGATPTAAGNTGNLANPGFVFAGWNTQNDGKGTFYPAGAVLTALSAAVSLYAVWQTVYSVTYYAPEAATGTVPPSVTGLVDRAAVVVAGNPGKAAKPKSAITGWNTQSDGKGTTYHEGNTFKIDAADVHLYAVWDPAYAVTYQATNSTSGTPPVDPNLYVYKQSYTVVGNTGALARSGFYFAGWNTQADGGGTDFAPGSSQVMGTSDVVLYPVWTNDPVYKVVYQPGSASSGTVPVDAAPHKTGDTVTVAGNPGSLARDHFAWAGWSLQTDGSGTKVTALTMGSADVTLYPQWTAAYAVTYAANNGTGAVPADPAFYLPLASATVLDNTGNLTRSGYRFSGWNTQADGKGITYAAGNSLTVANADVVLYAVWTPVYSVTYLAPDSLDPTKVPVDGKAYNKGDTATVLGNTFGLTKTGFAFSGWTTGTGGSGKAYAPADDLVVGSSNVVLYAAWVPTYTVTYLANGAPSGTVPMDTRAYRSGDLATVAANTGNLARANWTFVGWSDGQGSKHTPGSTMAITASTVLSAIWTQDPTYLVTYDGASPNAGSVPASSNHFADETVTVLGNSGDLAKSGYLFGGWSWNGTTYPANSSFTMPAGPVTLTAVWTPLYGVTYAAPTAESGSVPTDTGLYLAGAPVTVLDNTGGLTRQNYVLAGWTADPNGTGTTYAAGSTLVMPGSNTTLYALWSPRASAGFTFQLGTYGSFSFPAGGTTVAQGASVTLAPAASAVASGATGWQWTVDGAAAGTASALVFDASGRAPGTYQIGVSAVYGPVLYSGTTQVTVSKAVQSFAYVACYGTNKVVPFRIASTGASPGLTAGPAAATGSHPEMVVTTPDGRYLYTGNTGDATVSAFSVDGSTGNLTAVGTYPVAGGAQLLALNPRYSASSATHNYLYVGDTTNNKVSAFAINPANGALTLVSGSPFALGDASTAFTNFYALGVDPSGNYLDVTSNNGSTALGGLWIYALSPSTGAILGGSLACQSQWTRSLAYHPVTGALYFHDQSYLAECSITNGGATVVPKQNAYYYHSLAGGGNMAVDAQGRFLFSQCSYVNGSYGVLHSLWRVKLNTDGTLVYSGSGNPLDYTNSYQIRVDGTADVDYVASDPTGNFLITSASTYSSAGVRSTPTGPWEPQPRIPPS